MHDRTEQPSPARDPDIPPAPLQNPILQNNFDPAGEPVTENQIRRGPKTDAGRAKISKNAIKFGIYSERPVTDWEDPRAWDYHLKSTLKALRPKGYMELQLAQRVALLEWRLCRITVFETASINSALADLPERIARIMRGRRRDALGEEPEPMSMEEFQRMASLCHVPSGDHLEKIMRCDTQLHRQRNQTLHELEALQARRRGEQAPLARLDVTNSG
jgi:hypothetical protein